MNIELDREILNRLDAIAAKLGTTVTALWPQRVRAVKIRAAYSLACAAVCLVMAPVCAYLCWLCAEAAMGPGDGEGYALLGLGLGVVTFAFGFGVFINGDYFDDWLCPEEKALDGLLAAVRGRE